MRNGSTGSSRPRPRRRRGAARLLAGGVIGALVPRLGPVDAVAAGQETGATCRSDAHCCFGRCRGGTCACAAIIRECEATCRALLADACARLGVAARRVRVLERERAGWGDACLGCVPFGAICLAVTSEGFRLVVAAAGAPERRLVYHADNRRNFGVFPDVCAA